MDYDVRLSYSEEIFRGLLTDEYFIKEEEMEILINDCKNSLKLLTSSPLYDIIFHRVIQDVLDSYKYTNWGFKYLVGIYKCIYISAYM